MENENEYDLAEKVLGKVMPAPIDMDAKIKQILG